MNYLFPINSLNSFFPRGNNFVMFHLFELLEIVCTHRSYSAGRSRFSSYLPCIPPDCWFQPFDRHILVYLIIAVRHSLLIRIWALKGRWPHFVYFVPFSDDSWFFPLLGLSLQSLPFLHQVLALLPSHLSLIMMNYDFPWPNCSWTFTYPYSQFLWGNHQ